MKYRKHKDIENYAAFRRRTRKTRDALIARKTFTSPIELHGTAQPRRWLVDIWLGVALIQEAQTLLDRSCEALAKAEDLGIPVSPSRVSEARRALRAVSLDRLIPTQVCPWCRHSGRACEKCNGTGCL